MFPSSYDKTKLRILKILGYIFLPLLLMTACSDKDARVRNGAFTPTVSPIVADYDFDEILSSGELIIATMSGPDTYFDYQGKYLGMQYALASHFAQQNGLRVRVELAHSIAGMFKLLKREEVDIVCYQLPDSLIQKEALCAAGVTNAALHTSWAVRKDAPQLAAELKKWYAQGVELTVEREEKVKMKTRRIVRRKVRAPYISKSKGIISSYDNYFKSAARYVGWDWRLIAAQCYQESGFDPGAESWAGARGLMQIMPYTADHLGLSKEQIYEPQANVAAAARYLKELNAKFSDIREPLERIKFVLAAYNGGAGHVRDAMTLARKFGRDPKRWSDVGAFVLRLSEPEYYRDPDVKYGYMIGSETYNYVISIWDRWRAYGGVAASIGTQVNNDGSSGPRVRKKNRFTRGTKIYRPDDPEFNQLKQE